MHAGKLVIVSWILVHKAGFGYVSLWSYGPLDGGFPKEVYGRAKGADKFLISQQPALKHTWNAVAPSFWEVRYSIACAASDAEY